MSTAPEAIESPVAPLDDGLRRKADGRSPRRGRLAVTGIVVLVVAVMMSMAFGLGWLVARRGAPTAAAAETAGASPSPSTSVSAAEPPSSSSPAPTAVMTVFEGCRKSRQVMAGLLYDSSPSVGELAVHLNGLADVLDQIARAMSLDQDQREFAEVAADLYGLENVLRMTSEDVSNEAGTQAMWRADFAALQPRESDLEQHCHLAGAPA